jgi:hypothetical protein
LAVTVTPKALGRFGFVLDLEALICGAQMLLDGGLRNEQTTNHLRVGQSLGDQFQDLLLAEGDDTEVHGLSSSTTNPLSSLW